MQTITFATTASTDVTGGYTRLEMDANDLPQGNTSAGTTSLRFFVRGTHASVAATLEMALRRNSDGTIIARYPGTVAVTTRRDNNAGTGGKYICTIVWTASGTEFFDVAGAERTTQSAGNPTTGYSWYLGATSVTNVDASNLLVVEVEAVRGT